MEGDQASHPRAQRPTHESGGAFGVVAGGGVGDCPGKVVYEAGSPQLGITGSFAAQDGRALAGVRTLAQASHIGCTEVASAAWVATFAGEAPPARPVGAGSQLLPGEQGAVRGERGKRGSGADGTRTRDPLLAKQVL